MVAVDFSTTTKVIREENTSVRETGIPDVLFIALVVTYVKSNIKTIYLVPHPRRWLGPKKGRFGSWGGIAGVLVDQSVRGMVVGVIDQAGLLQPITNA